jgi:hypothetical protein
MGQLLRRGFGPVLAPDDHRHVTDVAVGDPANRVFVEPFGEPSFLAQLAADDGGARRDRYRVSHAGDSMVRPYPEVNPVVGNLKRLATIDDVRAVTASLPRSYEVVVRDRVKFRVRRIVYLGFSRDEQIMGFAFPKDEREALVESEPEKFLMPAKSDLRYNWVCARLAALDREELRELVLDAWQMVVPRKVAVEYLQERG